MIEPLLGKYMYKYMCSGLGRARLAHGGALRPLALRLRASLDRMAR
jgi:hypothetical protein